MVVCDEVVAVVRSDEIQKRVFAVVVAVGDQLAEARGARDVGALTDVDERDFRRELERLQP